MLTFHLQINEGFLYIWKYMENIWCFLNCKHTQNNGPGQDLWEHPITLLLVAASCQHLL